MEKSETVTLREAAKILNISYSTIKRWATRGIVQSHKFVSDKHHYVPRCWVEEMSLEMGSDAYTTRAVALMLGRTHQYVDYLIKTNRIEAVRLPSGRYRIPAWQVRELPGTMPDPA